MKTALKLFPLLLLSACASMTSGSTQTINIATTPLSGASCVVSNDRNSLSATTPAALTVQRSKHALNVTCVSGEYRGATSVTPDLKNAALFGGALGMSYDMGTGAAYDYPDLITVNLAR